MKVQYVRVGQKANQVILAGPDGIAARLTWEDGNRDDVERMYAAANEAEPQIKRLSQEIAAAEELVDRLYNQRMVLEWTQAGARDIATLILTGGQPSCFELEVIPDASHA